MSNWQKCADANTRLYFGNQNRFDAHKWLQATESAIRPLFEDEQSDRKHVYFVPLDDGNIIEADFHKNYTIVSEYDTDMNKKEIVSRRASERGETNPIRSYGAQLKKDKRGLGYPFPEALMNMFKALRPDEMFTFENGVTFLCTEKNGNIVTLKKVCGNILDGTTDVTALLDEGKTFDVDASSAKDMQSLYRLIYDRLTDSAKGRISSYKLIKDYVDTLKKSAGNNSDKRLDLGPIEVHLKKPFMSAAKFTDTDNKVLTDSQITSVYAWMSNAPVITSFIHEDDNMANDFDDTSFFESIEQFYKEGKFENVYRSICEYVLRKEGTLKVEIKTYIRSDDDFYADGFVFSYEKRSVYMRRAQFEDNDITKRIVFLKKTQTKIFTEFCAEKYNSDFFLMKNKKRAILRKSLPKSEYVIS